MGNVKSAFEKAMEKLSAIGELTEKEKEHLRETEKVREIVAEYYKGRLTIDGLWEKLKGFDTVYLREAQDNMLSSLRLGNIPEEYRIRKEGILAIEALKEERNIPAIENLLNSLEMLQKEFEEGKKEALEQMKKAIEENPQFRMRPVRAPDGSTAMQPSLSIDEEVEKRIAEFILAHEQRYESMFERLKSDVERELAQR